METRQQTLETRLNLFKVVKPSRCFEGVMPELGYQMAFEIPALPVPNVSDKGKLRIDVGKEVRFTYDSNSGIYRTLRYVEYPHNDAIDLIVREISIDPKTGQKEIVDRGSVHLLKELGKIREVHKDIIYDDPSLPESAKSAILRRPLVCTSVSY